jgi:hypothetical protein
VYDGISLGGVGISVIDTNAPFGNTPIQGRYSTFLFGDPALFARISQTGLIPIGTRSLQMQIWPAGGSFTVSVGGQEIPMVSLMVQPTYTLYGGDVSAFAGQVAEMSITANLAIIHSPNAVELDSILFSGLPIPEPRSGVLVGLGMLLRLISSKLARRRN